MRREPLASTIASIKEKATSGEGRPWLRLYGANGLLREIGGDRPLDHEQRLLQGSFIEVEEVGLLRRVFDDLVDELRIE